MSGANQDFETLEDIATTWAVRRAAGLTPEQQAEFERWLAANPLHYAAYAEADLAMSVLQPPTSPEERMQLREQLADLEQARRSRHARRRRWLAFSALGMAAAVLLVTLVPSNKPRPPDTAPPGTMTPRPLLQRLADRSIVELNANTEIAVEFTSQERLIRLVRGEAHFTVAKDPARPFVVAVGRVKVRAVGTRFNVRFTPDEVDVLTTEGRVSVVDESGPASSAERKVDLTAGYRTTVPLAPATSATLPVSAASPSYIQHALAWRQMRFELSNATLEQAVAWFNERSVTQFAIGDADLRTRRLSGIYWADNPTQFAELVAASLDLKIVRERSDRIVFRRR